MRKTIFQTICIAVAAAVVISILSITVRTALQQYRDAIAFQNQIESKGFNVHRLLGKKLDDAFEFTLVCISDQDRMLAFYDIYADHRLQINFQDRPIRRGWSSFTFQVPLEKTRGIHIAGLYFLPSDPGQRTGTQDYLFFRLDTVGKPWTESVIGRKPLSQDGFKGPLESVPSYDPSVYTNTEVDLKGYDLNALDLAGRAEDLLHSDFDSSTRWPKALPDTFDPATIMELGKNPGLGLRDLHRQGITGKGISIAIIDQALLVDHVEYRDRLACYEELHCFSPRAQMHGPAVASIAVGKTVGVAPEATLYYIAETHLSSRGHGETIWEMSWLARAIDRVLEINRDLPEERRIRVISMSVGWDWLFQQGYLDVQRSVEKAKQENIFVVSSSLFETYGFRFHGLGRHPLADPDTVASYRPGLWWADNFYKHMHTQNFKRKRLNPTLMVPMDSRCIAAPTGERDYVFYRDGGWSWSIPYIAGLYVLACQVKPDITPDIFWETALETGDYTTFDHEGKRYTLENIVNPVNLIESLRAATPAQNDDGQDVGSSSHKREE